MPEVVHVLEGGTEVRTELFESLRKGNSTLRVVTVSDSVLRSRWTADSE
jgi:hypothetical protein